VGDGGHDAIVMTMIMTVTVTTTMANANSLTTELKFIIMFTRLRN
jgi:hypothetical protein